MSLLNVVVLGHIIYPPFYDDVMVQSDPPKEYLFAIGRKKAQELLNHLSKVLNLRKCGQRVDFKPLFVTYFVQQVRCLVRHHFAASKRHSGPAGDSRTCTSKALCQAIAASFSTKDWFLEELQSQKKVGHCDTTYALVSEDEYSIDAEVVEAAGMYYSIQISKLIPIIIKSRSLTSCSLRSSLTMLRMSKCLLCLTRYIMKTRENDHVYSFCPPLHCLRTRYYEYSSRWGQGRSGLVEDMSWLNYGWILSHFVGNDVPSSCCSSNIELDEKINIS